MLHVILLHPEIPPNTGNAMRLCANTGAELHLVEPLGFTLDDSRLRRAGLDYAEWSRIHVHADLQSCLLATDAERCFALTTRGTASVYATCFRPGDALLFGQETAGLPDAVLAGIPPERWLRLPMRPDSRSLNLSNAVAVTVFEAWRQLGFPGAR
ncbi:tRNA (cytidine(34)-2'-O)-methyltransferase [Aquisalimonas sp. 2447]|uniref:tRNA (cytidine(34)-2'-O)-methyltransferase n=1 Tax=Aquisalimonas sp. 2447 TaxID=2740807 RepID=UPI0014323A30|nr:tRNA (cytidine(34)-2'-O)-methyltransferase [Aquisalimonas sp. 2447]QIT53752.1 tRNA (cytidine(34)-2'-O)-methyltransferase [Aquisalimonas sp. 2447]